MNDLIFNSYLVGEEREAAIEESATQVFFNNIDMMIEMVDMQLEYDKKAAEFKVFSEGGTYDDFLYLLEEANAEANEKKKGILATLIDGIIKILNKIGEKLAAIGKNPGDPNEDVEVDEGVVKSQNALDSIAGDINSTIDAYNAAQNGDVGGFLTNGLNLFSGKGKIAAALTAAGVGVTTGVMIKIKRGKAAKDAEKNGKLKTKISNFMQKLKGQKDKEEDNTKTNQFVQFLNAVKDTVVKVIDFIASGLSSVWHGVANKLFGKWKEVPADTEGAFKCIKDGETPEEGKKQMTEEDLRKKGVENPEPEHWYKKETEGGTKAREGKEEKAEQSNWKKAEGNDLNSADCYLVVPNSVTPEGKQKKLSEAEKLVPGIKANESIISIDASKEAAGFEVSITPEELAKAAGISDSEYKNLTKNDDERGKIEKIKNWVMNKQFTSEQLNRMADHIWERVGKHKELASQAQWGMDSKSWNSIPEPVQRIIKDRVNKSKASNKNESAVDELLINPFVDYVRESDDYNMEISEIADMLASL